MGKFKTGEKAVVKDSKPSDSTLRKNQVVTIIRELPHGSFEVEEKNGNTWWLSPDQLYKKKGGSNANSNN